jgi:hypothetical protein
LGFVVETGSVVWNEHKEKFTENGTLLIWNENIVDYNLSLNKKDKQFIKGLESRYENGIVFKRIISEKNFCYVGVPFLAENHVNVLKNKENKITTEKMFRLLKQANVDKYISYFTDSVQISSKELEELPLWGVLRKDGAT